MLNKKRGNRVNRQIATLNLKLTLQLKDMNLKKEHKSVINICAIMCLCVAAFILCPNLSLAGKTTKIVDRIVAVVNHDLILLSELNQSVGTWADKIKAADSHEEQRKLFLDIRSRMLNELIDQKLIDQKAKQRRIRVSEKEIDLAIQRLKEANYYTDEQFTELLASDNLTIGMYRAKIKNQILRSKLIAQEIGSKIVVTKEEIETYYQSSKEYGKRKKYHLRNIIMKVLQLAEHEEKLAMKLEMEEILKKLKKEKSFNLEKSNALSIDLGFFDFETLSPQIKSAVAGLGPGEFTQVLDTDAGFQIFFIQDIVIDSGQPLEQVSQKIEDHIYQDKVNKKIGTWLQELRKRSHIKRYEL